MPGQRGRRDNGATAAGLALLALALTACTGQGRTAPAASRLPALAAVLRALPDVRHGELRAMPALPNGGGVLVVDDRAAPAASALPATGREALQAFLAAGGRLVLLGHAAALVTALGVEAEAPEATTFRWGFDARAVAGRADLGLQVVSGALPELFADEALAADANAPLWLAGDTPCTAPVCAWSIGAPRAGATLARLAAARDGAADPAGAPVVVHWQVGAGEVLACGLLPRADHPDERVRAAAAGFLQRTAVWAARGRACLVLTDEPTAAPPPALALPPMAPLVPHWGWQAPQQAGGGERTADEVVAEVLQPSWLAGADLAMVEIGDAAGAAPLAWSTEDPLRPAPSFRARPPGVWHDAALRSLALEAHGRGMTALGALEPLPVGDRAVERLVALRFLARELACVRRFGPGAFDGFALPTWSLDRAGRTLAMAQDFQPAAVIALLGEQAPEVGGARRALDADDGALGFLPLCGLADGWRSEGFAAATFALGALDARAGAAGGGRAATADWIVAQANAFARARGGQGAALWWRRHDADTLRGGLGDYVEGCSLEPLRAAVAMPLSATGQDGVRAAAAALVPAAPAAFAAAAPAPAAVHALQNNWFRLLGSGGALTYDPTGRADFGATALSLSPALLRTRLFGARPDAASVRHERLDLLARGFAGEGGHGDERFVDLTTPTSPLPPAQLATASAPTWPASVRFQLDLDFGYHELDVVVRPMRGRGVLLVSLDDVLLRALPFDAAANAPVAATVPVHAARKGARTLVLATLAGGACALERLVLARAGDVGVEAAVATPAGSFASLREASQSTYHAEVVTLDAMADLPGFVVRARCERSVRNLQVERTLALPAHDELAAAAGESADDLRSAFVLRRRGGGAPDVVVVPMQRARHDTLRWRPGELTWHSAPDAGMQTRFGVLFVPAGEGQRRRDEAQAVLAALADPAALDFREHRAATMQCLTPFPMARLLRIDSGATTPFLVQEEGWWTMRGSQRGPDGVRWLRIRETPGAAVQIVEGPSVLARTRPGPGSLRLLALRDPEPLSATVRVLQASALGTPSVVMARDFADAQVDGVDWAHHDGRTIFLPNRQGDFAVRARDHAGGKGPHVRRTAAPLTVCRYLPAERTLVLATAGAAERPAELPWTAVLGGPRPIGIENGEIVDDATLRLPDAAATAAARGGGTLVRFGSGVCRIRYAD